jgi:hypothetical protein
LLKLADEIIVSPIILGELLAGFATGRREKRKRTRRVMQKIVRGSDSIFATCVAGASTAPGRLRSISAPTRP